MTKSIWIAISLLFVSKLGITQERSEDKNKRDTVVTRDSSKAVRYVINQDKNSIKKPNTSTSGNTPTINPGEGRWQTSSETETISPTKGYYGGASQSNAINPTQSSQSNSSSTGFSTPVEMSRPVDMSRPSGQMSRPTGNMSRPVELSKAKGEISKPVDLSRPAGEISRPVEISKPTGDISKPVEISKPNGEMSSPVDLGKPTGNISRPVELSTPTVDVSRPIGPMSTPIKWTKEVEMTIPVFMSEPVLFSSVANDPNALVYKIDESASPLTREDLLKYSGFITVNPGYIVRNVMDNAMSQVFTKETVTIIKGAITILSCTEFGAPVCIAKFLIRGESVYKRVVAIKNFFSKSNVE